VKVYRNPVFKQSLLHVSAAGSSVSHSTGISELQAIVSEGSEAFFYCPYLT
jgi:hypothetical protein